MLKNKNIISFNKRNDIIIIKWAFINIFGILFTDKNVKICTFLKIQVVYKLLVLKQKEENIIQYFIFTSNQKSACLEVSNCYIFIVFYNKSVDFQLFYFLIIFYTTSSNSSINCDRHECSFTSKCEAYTFPVGG